MYVDQFGLVSKTLDEFYQNITVQRKHFNLKIITSRPDYAQHYFPIANYTSYYDTD